MRFQDEEAWVRARRVGAEGLAAQVLHMPPVGFGDARLLGGLAVLERAVLVRAGGLVVQFSVEVLAHVDVQGQVGHLLPVEDFLLVEHSNTELPTSSFDQKLKDIRALHRTEN